MPPAITVQSYQESLRRYATARAKLGSLTATIARVSELLSGWEKADPSQVNGQLHNATKPLPTTDIIWDAISEWKNAYAEMNRVWESLSSDERIGLIAPHQFKPTA